MCAVGGRGEGAWGPVCVWGGKMWGGGEAQCKDRYAEQIPKKVLFGAFCQRGPAHGLKKRF